jgi:hypothetical protein
MSTFIGFDLFASGEPFDLLSGWLVLMMLTGLSSSQVDDIDIIRTFTAKKSRKGHLPPNFI